MAAAVACWRARSAAVSRACLATHHHCFSLSSPSLLCFTAIASLSPRRYGFIVMDGNGSLFGTLCGNNREILHKVTVGGEGCVLCEKLCVGVSMCVHEQPSIRAATTSSSQPYPPLLTLSFLT